MSKGFTIIELLIVIAIIGILVAATIPIYGNMQASAQLNEYTSLIVQALRTARERSVAGYNDSSHGVRFTSQDFTVYQGSPVSQTADIRPDGDNVIEWLVVASSTCSGGHWCTLNEESANTNDYISNSSNSSDTDDFTMTSVAGIASSSQIQVYVYCTKSSINNGYIDINLNINGIDQVAQQISPPNNNVWGWRSATFSGLNLSQSDLDGLRIKLTSGKNGGQGEDLYVASLYATVTYTISQPDYSDYDEVTTVPEVLTITNTLAEDRVNFTKTSGIPDKTGTITLTHSISGTRTISVNSMGKVEEE